MSTELLSGVLPPVQRETLDIQIYSALRRAILNGALGAGEHLVQKEVAQRMGTSRIPVRDALKRLVGDGLINVDEHGRHVVASFGLEDAVEVYALRALLEPYAVAIATERLDFQSLQNLHELVAAMDVATESNDPDQFVELNQKFHLSLYEEGGQGRLLKIIESLWSGMPPRIPIAIPGQMAASTLEHRAILAAIRQRDSSAASKLMKEHIERTRRSFENHVRSKGDQ